MPELPEVETVKNTIIQFLKNEEFVEIDVRYERMILNDVATFKKTLLHKKINDITRVGKYILIHIDDDYVIISHLRMEGKYILLNAGEKPGKHARVVFTFASGRCVSYDDSRMFGIMKLVKEKDLKDDPLMQKVGPEPFDIQDGHYLYDKYRRLNGPIKATILDQSIMAGLGNIYADEVLFACGINPRTPGNTLTLKECQNIIDQSVKVLNKAIKLGGSTIRTYHAARGVDGKFQNELMVYGKANEPCPKCGHPLKKIRIGGRGTTYCPICQPLKKTSFVIGLTGVIAAGKSLALTHLQKMGIDGISCDEIVHNLYENPEVIQSVEKTVRQKIIVDGKLDRSLLRNIIVNNEKAKKRVEAIIHPMVEETLIGFIQKSQAPYLVIEVPLLFEADLSYLADATIGLLADQKVQRDNLSKRGCADIDGALKLYNDSFIAYQDKCDYIINVNGDENNLFNELENIIQSIKKGS